MKVTWTARARTRLAEIIAQDSKPRALAMVERILDRAEVLMLAPRPVPTRKVARRTLSSPHFGCGCPVGPVCHLHHDHAQSFRRILELWVQHRRRAGQIGAPC